MADPNEMSIGDFGRHMGYKGRYAYELQKLDRLVMTADGKRVKVRESIARIQETRDPSRAGVAARHAAERGYAITGQEENESADRLADGQPDAEGNPPQGAASGDSYQLQNSKAKREHYAALREELAFRKDAGELMESGEVIGAFADAAAKVAGVLDAVPATVGPMLAGLPQEEVLRLLSEQMDIARAEMAHALTKLAEEIEQRQKGAI